MARGVTKLIIKLHFLEIIPSKIVHIHSEPYMTMLGVCMFVCAFLEMLYVLIIMYSFILLSFFDCYIPHQKKSILYINWSCVWYLRSSCSVELMLACMSVVVIVVYQHE